MLPRTLPGARGVACSRRAARAHAGADGRGHRALVGPRRVGRRRACPRAGRARRARAPQAVGVAHSLLLLDDGRVLAGQGRAAGSWASARATDKVGRFSSWSTAWRTDRGAAGGYITRAAPRPAGRARPAGARRSRPHTVSDLARRTDWQRLAQLADRVLSSPVLAAASFVGADGTSHSFEACEACYQALLAAFDAAPSVVQAMSTALPRMLTALRQEMDDLIAAQAADHSARTARRRRRARRGRRPRPQPQRRRLLAAPLLTVLQSPLLSHPSEGRRRSSPASLSTPRPPTSARGGWAGRRRWSCPLDIFGGRIVAGLLRALDSALADAGVVGAVVGCAPAPPSSSSSACSASAATPTCARILPPDAFYSPWLSEHLDMERITSRGRSTAPPSAASRWRCRGPSARSRGSSTQARRRSCCGRRRFIRMSTVVQQSRAQGRARRERGDQLPVLQPVLGARRRCDRRRRLGASSRPASGVRGDFFVLRVRRDELINDTLEAVAEQSVQTLLKPLRVVFEGEPAIDEGGVRKELFQLLVDDLFGPQRGDVVVECVDALQLVPPGRLWRGGGILSGGPGGGAGDPQRRDPRFEVPAAHVADAPRRPPRRPRGAARHAARPRARADAARSSTTATTSRTSSARRSPSRRRA